MGIPSGIYVLLGVLIVIFVGGWFMLKQAEELGDLENENEAKEETLKIVRKGHAINEAPKTGGTLIASFRERAKRLRDRAARLRNRKPTEPK